MAAAFISLALIFGVAGWNIHHQKEQLFKQNQQLSMKVKRLAKAAHKPAFKKTEPTKLAGIVITNLETKHHG